MPVHSNSNANTNDSTYGSRPSIGHGASQTPLPTYEGPHRDAQCEHEREGHQLGVKDQYVELVHDPETGDLKVLLHEGGPYSEVIAEKVEGWADPAACGRLAAYEAEQAGKEQAEAAAQAEGQDASESAVDAGAPQSEALDSSGIEVTSVSTYEDQARAKVLVPPDDSDEYEAADPATMFWGIAAILVLVLGTAALIAGAVLSAKEKRQKRKAKR